MTLYLTPGAAQDGNYINFYYTKRIDDVGAYTNATDVPYQICSMYDFRFSLLS
jgi:hypothetical protein